MHFIRITSTLANKRERERAREREREKQRTGYIEYYIICYYIILGREERTLSPEHMPCREPPKLGNPPNMPEQNMETKFTEKCIRLPHYRLFGLGGPIFRGALEEPTDPNKPRTLGPLNLQKPSNSYKDQLQACHVSTLKSFRGDLSFLSNKPPIYKKSRHIINPKAL